MHKYGIGIIGAGNVARGHYRSIQKVPGAEVVAIADNRCDDAVEWAAAQGADCPLYDCLEDLIADPNVEIVLVTTPNFLHAEQATQVARAGKHVVVEKPIALNLAELRTLERAVADSGVTSMVGFVLHWNPGLRMAYDWVRSGMIGTPFMLETSYWHATDRAAPGQWMTTRWKAGSVFLMGGCHAVDAARWLAGSDIVEVSAVTTTGHKRWYEYDPTAIALVRFANGAVGRISACMECVMPYAFNFTVMGDKGTIRDNQLYSHLMAGQTGFATVPTVLPDNGAVDHHPFSGEWAEMIACLEAGRQPELNVAGAINTHEACLAVEISARERRAVTLPLEA